MTTTTMAQKTEQGDKENRRRNNPKPGKAKDDQVNQLKGYCFLLKRGLSYLNFRLIMLQLV